MSEKIYLKIGQRRFVKKPKVTIGDVIRFIARIET